MNKLVLTTLTVLCIMLSGCLSSCAALQFAHADNTNARDLALAHHDQQGADCYASTLAALDTFREIIAPGKPIGIATIAEARRIILPLAIDAELKCLGVYNVGLLLRPVFSLLGR
jgi:hypothetical protein